MGEDLIIDKELRKQLETDKKRKETLSEPIEAIDLEKIKTVTDLLDSFSKTSIQARNLSECRRIFEEMLANKERPTIFLGLSGPLIAAGLRKVIRDMIHYNLVDVVVSTGAVIYQDLYQARGYKHYKGDPHADDISLRNMLIDRIYDTYVDEMKFDETDHHFADWLETLEPRDYSSREILYILGKTIKDDQSILHTAAKNNVPVFCPALCDSSLGIGFTIYYGRNGNKKFSERVTLDNIRDNYEMLQIVDKSVKTSAIYIGGGVPKNWINDGVVMASYLKKREFDGHSYIFQVTMDSPQWGGLSGSTLKEAQSWGKVYRKATKAIANVEASVALPLIVGPVLHNPGIYKKRERLSMEWEGNILKKL